MNEQLQQEVAEVLKLSKDGVLKAADFLQQQAPELCEQILKWELINSLIWFSLGFLLLVIGSIYLKSGIERGNKITQSNHTNWREYGPLPVLWPGAYLILGFALTSNSLTWIKILVAPKLFLVEYILDLAK